MCGIVGLLGNLSAKDKLFAINSMNDKIVHRGPDDFGLWANDQAGFGMRRLSIVDLNGGHQPIWHENVGIVFNGEVYNHHELRKDLIDLGYNFTTKSDTEVVLKAYYCWGESFLQRLTGMFAICIIDLRTNISLIARDHTGIKPLYLCNHQGQIYFASEIKSFEGILPLSEIDYSSINDYLTFRFIPSEKTAWKNVKKLKPGSYLKTNLETMETQHLIYWQLNFNSKKIDKTTDYVKQFDTLFTQSLTGQLLADVPVGAFLSGGMDSTAICARAMQLGQKEFHTFSVAFEGDTEFSELAYASLVADTLGTTHHEVIVTKQQFLDFLDKQPYFTDDPLADLTSIPLYYLCVAAKKHVKVALSGEGADELLAGYDLHHAAQRASKRQFTSFFPKSSLKLMAHVANSKFKKQLELMIAGGWGSYVAVEPEYISTNLTNQQKSDLWISFNENYDSYDVIRAEYHAAKSPNPVDKLQQVLSSSWLVEDLLAKADKMSMAASLEVRVPFLDHRLVDWAMQLPLDWKTGNSKEGYTTKRVLREAFKHYVPSSIIERKKQGFSIPIYKWLETDLGDELFQKMIAKDFLDDWFNIPTLEKIFLQARQGNKNQQHNFWVLYTLGLWKKRWLSVN